VAHPTRPRAIPRHRRAASTPVARPQHATEPLVYRLLGRLIDSRLWIALLAGSLIVIVAMQLWVLKLNAGIGRAITHEALLQRETATLSRANAELSAGDRVEGLAASEEGMVIVPAGATRFLDPRGALDTRLAAAALARPVQALTTSTQTASGATGAQTSAASTGTQTPGATASAGGAAGEVSTGTAAPAEGAASATSTATSSTRTTAGEPASGGEGMQAAAATGAAATTEAPRG
jgi:hypothetical protein